MNTVLTPNQAASADAATNLTPTGKPAAPSSVASSPLPPPGPLPGAMDLAHRAPRSLRCRLGGFAVLPRLLDKCRATIAGTAGEYHFNCPLDRQFFDFTGIDAGALRRELAAGRTDGEMLAWVRSQLPSGLGAWAIEAWSDYQERRLPASDPETAGFFARTLAAVGPGRADIQTWADLIDLDDHVSFGGRA